MSASMILTLIISTLSATIFSPFRVYSARIALKLLLSITPSIINVTMAALPMHITIGVAEATIPLAPIAVSISEVPQATNVDVPLAIPPTAASVMTFAVVSCISSPLITDSAKAKALDMAVPIAAPEAAAFKEGCNNAVLPSARFAIASVVSTDIPESIITLLSKRRFLNINFNWRNENDIWQVGNLDWRINMANLICKLYGSRGRSISIFDKKCEIVTDVTIGSVMTRNATDGCKTIFYKDCIGLQFKKSGLLIGYLQFETGNAQMNNLNSNTFSENTFTFEDGKNGVTNSLMEDIYYYLSDVIEGYKYDDESLIYRELPSSLIKISGKPKNFIGQNLRQTSSTEMIISNKQNQKEASQIRSAETKVKDDYVVCKFCGKTYRYNSLGCIYCHQRENDDVAGRTTGVNVKCPRCGSTDINPDGYCNECWNEVKISY